ncbi:MAG TPA: SPOR domain-containing protein [Terriglobales bacterium]|nr:SPOR domain-containing protein [Terriglobales bacterium]
MPTSQQDTEITLGTGRMLALFFTFVLVCAVFFAIGFSLGRKTSASTGSLPGTSSAAPATVVRPSVAKDGSQQSAQQPVAQPSDFSFYKSVSSKTTDAELKPADVQQPTTEAAKNDPPKNDPPKTASTSLPSTPAGGGYFVQVAAVTRQEDAEALVDALKKKQYPAFAANNPATDKFFHVQVGPYGDLKDAESMRARLIADGYNPILKR